MDNIASELAEVTAKRSTHIYKTVDGLNIHVDVHVPKQPIEGSPAIQKKGHPKWVSLFNTS